MTNFIAGISGMLTLIAYIIYGNKILSGNIKSSVATWLVIGFISILNTLTYLKTAKHFWISSRAVIGGFGSAIIGTIMIIKNPHLGALSNLEIAVLIVGVLAVAVWIKKDAGHGNLVVMVAVYIATIPLLVGQYYGTVQENPTVWFLWAASAAFQMWSIFRMWKEQPENKNGLQLAYPIAGVGMHLMVGTMALF